MKRSELEEKLMLFKLNPSIECIIPSAILDLEAFSPGDLAYLREVRVRGIEHYSSDKIILRVSFNFTEKDFPGWKTEINTKLLE